MTRMSEPHAEPTRDFAPNPARLLEGSRLAHRVHDRGVPVSVLLSLLVAGACVIPPSLSVEQQDAGINSPPAITAVRAEDKALVEADVKEPAVFVQGDGSLSISLLDTDVADTLYVRIFVNYTLQKPENYRSACVASAGTTPRRTATCDLLAVCQMGDIDANDLLHMTVHVFDRMPLDVGDPPHQAMPEGGLSSSKFFFLDCVGRSM